MSRKHGIEWFAYTKRNIKQFGGYKTKKEGRIIHSKLFINIICKKHTFVLKLWTQEGPLNLLHPLPHFVYALGVEVYSPYYLKCRTQMIWRKLRGEPLYRCQKIAKLIFFKIMQKISISVFVCVIYNNFLDMPNTTKL